MTLHQLWLVLRSRWLVFAAVFGTIVLATLVAGIFTPRQYTATAAVVIDAKNDPVAAASNPAMQMTSYIATQVDVISSDRVARRVVKAMKLDQQPYYQELWRSNTDGRGDIVAWIAGAKLKKSLTVTPSRESNMIEIAVTWVDPELAAAFANAFAQAYIDTNIEMKVEPAKQYAAWFEERSKALRTDLEAKQKRLADFEKQSGIVATDEHLDIELARLNELSTQLVAIQGLREDSQSRERQAGGNNERLPEVLQSPLISNLKAELSLAEAKMQDIATTLGKNHPDYQTTSAQIASLRSRIAEESAKIASSLGSANRVNVDRENEVRAALEAQKQRVLDLQSKHDAVSVLQNEVATAQRDLDAVTQRLAQSNLESQSQQTNILLLTPAVPPTYPSSPHVRLNLLLAVFLGSILGLLATLGLEFTDERVRESKALNRLTEIPLLGTIGRRASWRESRRALRHLRADDAASPLRRITAGGLGEEPTR